MADTIRSKAQAIQNGNSISRYVLVEAINEPGQKMYRYYHHDTKSGRYAVRSFIMTEGLYVNYLWYNRKEQLEKMLESGRLYREIIHSVRQANKAVKAQVEKWKQTDAELKVASLNGDDDSYIGLLNNLYIQAEEIVYKICFGDNFIKQQALKRFSA